MPDQEIYRDEDADSNPNVPPYGMDEDFLYLAPTAAAPLPVQGSLVSVADDNNQAGLRNIHGYMDLQTLMPFETFVPMQSGFMSHLMPPPPIPPVPSQTPPFGDSANQSAEIQPIPVNADNPCVKQEAHVNETLPSWYDPYKVTPFIPDEVIEVDPKLPKRATGAFAAQSSKYGEVDPIYWVPEEFTRSSTGLSVVDSDSILGDSGRTYNGYREGKYFLPNDAAEQDRLDLQHAGLKVLLSHKLYLAPIQSPRYVCDLACGTGLWTFEFAEEHPEAKVIGIDLSSIQPRNGPENVEFIKGDCEDSWEFPFKFDYVHARAVFTCFNDHRTVMRHAFDNLKPGGWVEYGDGSIEVGCLDGSTEGTAIKRWGELMQQGGLALGRELHVAQHYKQWLTEVGFVDVVEKKLAWAFGPWPKDRRQKKAGAYCQADLYEGIRGISWVFLNALGMSELDIDKLVLDVRADLVNPAVHSFLPIWVVYGRKPFDHEIEHPWQESSVSSTSNLAELRLGEIHSWIEQVRPTPVSVNDITRNNLAEAIEVLPANLIDVPRAELTSSNTRKRNQTLTAYGAWRSTLTLSSDTLSEMAQYATYPSLRGKTVLITGGAEGIGAAAVELFCKQGSKVIFLDYSEASAARLLERVKGISEAANPTFMYCDLTNLDALKECAEQVLADHGKVDVLINNLGAAGPKSRVASSEVTPESFDYDINVNLRHQFFFDTAGIVGMTRVHSKEFGKYGIRVNSIMPGSIATERQVQEVLTEEYEANTMAAQSLKRRLLPEEVARLMLFLAAEDSSAITGSSYVIDGGWVSDK
ncbi:uncharacterized protein JN550_008269 [Neoarthrinium moseri]|uniref:uncharacterized protein n=1 Tax=Neoarthrinium moseri TaxID=1658444 RepID=UPI001FDE6C1B|nr:uncharacterized protein JN550_008269 [Neoarthrinium moseri]KAI1865512.1 hypothetical protein JN550_008269 [Neoarthrinium moseri]